MSYDDRINDFNYYSSAEKSKMQPELEELPKCTSFTEVCNAKNTGIFENVVFKGKRRYYIEDLTERDYTLENTTPYQLEISGHVIEEHSWGNLLCHTAELLLDIYPNYLDKMLDFRCPWSKAQMFTLEKKTNYKPIKRGYYINCNHTALHACWFLQDLLDYFMIDKASVSFLIHRPSSAEPKIVKDYVERQFKRNFAEYIRVYYQKSDEYADKVVRVIEKYLNPILLKISKSYTNIFLFDDNAILSNYLKKIETIINSNYNFDKRAKKILNRYLSFLWEFYKQH